MVSYIVKKRDPYIIIYALCVHRKERHPYITIDTLYLDICYLKIGVTRLILLKQGSKE
jgi:hypothetical protein